MTKVAWSGEILGVQPRIDLLRSFDQRQHSYLGYLLLLRGEAGGQGREFSARIGPGAQAKHGFRAGDSVSGAALIRFHRIRSAVLRVTHRRTLALSPRRVE